MSHFRNPPTIGFESSLSSGENETSFSLPLPGFPSPLRTARCIQRFSSPCRLHTTADATGCPLCPSDKYSFAILSGSPHSPRTRLPSQRNTQEHPCIAEKAPSVFSNSLLTVLVDDFFSFNCVGHLRPDLHIGESPDAAGMAKMAVAEINQQVREQGDENPIKFVVVLGDLTHSGT